jgi:hypothetical protein
VKATIREYELEGTKVEIAEVLAGIMAARTPQLAAPVETVDAIDVEHAEIIEPEPVEAAPVPQPAFGVTRADNPYADLERTLYDIAGEEPAEPIVDEPLLVLQGGPFEKAEDIPAPWRRVGDNGMTCHIRTHAGGEEALCGSAKIGRSRVKSTEIPFPTTAVCQLCNNALVRSRRPK